MAATNRPEGSSNIEARRQDDVRWTQQGLAMGIDRLATPSFVRIREMASQYLLHVKSLTRVREDPEN